MKTLLTIAAALAAVTSVSAAFAKDASTNDNSSRYQWQSSQSFGPRAPLTIPTRVWVSNAKEVANCDCAMMHDTAMSADCMAMPHKSANASHG